MIDSRFLKLLACPFCPQRPPLKEDEPAKQLICPACGRRYPVRDGIPVLMPDNVVKE